MDFERYTNRIQNTHLDLIDNRAVASGGGAEGGAGPGDKKWEGKGTK